MIKGCLRFILFAWTLLLVGCVVSPPATPTSPASVATPTPTIAPTASPAPSASPTADADADGFSPAQYPVAMAMFALTHPQHRILQLGFLEAAETLGYDARIIGTDNSDQDAVYAACEKAAKDGVKGIVLWAGDESCFPLLEKLHKAGVAVVIPHFIFDPAPEGLTLNLAGRPERYGAQCAEFMAGRLEGKRGTVLISCYSDNLSEAAAAKAFKARLLELIPDGLSVIGPLYEGDDFLNAPQTLAAALKEHPDTVAAYGTSGNSAVLLAEAAELSGLSPDQLIIVGTDYTKQNLGLLSAGRIAALIGQPLYEETYIAMHMLDRHFRIGDAPRWMEVDAPLIYPGGVGASDPALYEGVIAESEQRFTSPLP